MKHNRLAFRSLVQLGDTPPSEFRIFAAGTNTSTKGPAVFDDRAAELVMAAYRQHGVELSIDYNHGAVDPAPVDYALAGRAAGWFAPEVRDGELWAVNVRWTPAAYKAIEDKEWRYFSPAFWYEGDSDRVAELVNVALTNTPATDNLHALVAASALARRSEGMSDEQRRLALRLLGELLAVRARKLTRRAGASEVHVKDAARAVGEATMCPLGLEGKERPLWDAAQVWLDATGADDTLRVGLEESVQQAEAAEKAEDYERRDAFLEAILVAVGLAPEPRSTGPAASRASRRAPARKPPTFTSKLKKALLSFARSPLWAPDPKPAASRPVAPPPDPEREKRRLQIAQRMGTLEMKRATVREPGGVTRFGALVPTKPPPGSPATHNRNEETTTMQNEAKIKKNWSNVLEKMQPEERGRFLAGWASLLGLDPLTATPDDIIAAMIEAGEAAPTASTRRRATRGRAGSTSRLPADQKRAMDIRMGLVSSKGHTVRGRDGFTRFGVKLTEAEAEALARKGGK